ncbi:hypothetical protein ACLB1G_18905 [Oxalobacteraceae bacterium A2-2]
MNIAKNMEAIFLAVAVLGGATAYATAAQPEIVVPYSTPVVAAAQADQAMPVVVVAAKRLSAAEKAALVQ